MDGKRLIRSIKLTNLLSFGPDGMEIELQPLNVLIGANGSGKSNLVAAFRLLHAAQDNMTRPFVEAGDSVSEWLWKGEVERAATIETVANEPDIDPPLTHVLTFMSVGQQIRVHSEQISLLEKSSKNNLFYRYVAGLAKIYRAVDLDDINAILGVHIDKLEPLKIGTVVPSQSILSQRNDPEVYPALYGLSRVFGGFAFFAESYFGKAAPVRRPQAAILDQAFPFEDFSNLALVINDLQNQPQVMRAIIEKLKLFYGRVENIITRVQGGTVQIYFQEAGLTQTVPATRLSDGTLRYLCLLVLLLHPTPPPLMCVEEPELGMHPDILPTIAELLVEASQRTQLIVTTHSDLLISKIGEVAPEAVVVCERTDRGTTLQRLDPEPLKEWLEKYTLGDLWLKGEIGGTRW